MGKAKKDFIGFLESLKEKNMFEIQKIANKEHLKYEKSSPEYSEYIHEFLFFICNGIKPSRITYDEFLLYKPLCKDLVENHHLKKEILDLFKQE